MGEVGLRSRSQFTVPPSLAVQLARFEVPLDGTPPDATPAGGAVPARSPAPLPTDPATALAPGAALPVDPDRVVEVRYRVPGSSGPSNILLRGIPCHVRRIHELLDTFALTATGRETLSAIAARPHQLTIEHDENVLTTNGATRYPLSSALWNGVGVDAKVFLDLRIPDEGSHLVEGTDHPIPFQLDVILAHELAHARRVMEGAPRHVFDFEDDTIIDENRYRAERAARLGIPVEKRLGHDWDEQRWFPDATTPVCACRAHGR